MPLLPRRYERLRSVLNRRMGDLTVLLEQVDKPHNLSAILRTCDAVGVLESHVVSLPGRPRIFNDTALGSQKWVPLHAHATTEEAIAALKARGFRLYGTHLSQEAIDYRDCDFTGPTAFLLGAEKWGLSEAAAEAAVGNFDKLRFLDEDMSRSDRRAGAGGRAVSQGTDVARG